MKWIRSWIFDHPKPRPSTPPGLLLIQLFVLSFDWLKCTVTNSNTFEADGLFIDIMLQQTQALAITQHQWVSPFMLQLDASSFKPHWSCTSVSGTMLQPDTRPRWEPVTHRVLQSHTQTLTGHALDRAGVFTPHSQIQALSAITDPHRTTSSAYKIYPATSMMYGCVCESSNICTMRIWPLVKDSNLLEYSTGKAFRPIHIWQDSLQYLQDECRAQSP